MIDRGGLANPSGGTEMRLILSHINHPSPQRRVSSGVRGILIREFRQGPPIGGLGEGARELFYFLWSDLGGYARMYPDNARINFPVSTGALGFRI